MPPGVVQLVSARANDALGEVDVPVSISNAPNSMVVVNLAYDVAKKGGDDITEANSTVNEFAKQTAEINGTTQAVEKLRIVDALCKVVTGTVTCGCSPRYEGAALTFCRWALPLYVHRQGLSMVSK